MSPRTDLVALRDFALELADAADRLMLDGFAHPGRTRHKDDGSPVTDVDVAVERALRERIGVTHPDHAVLGEEEGGGPPSDGVTWVIDPIDATRNFVRGIPVFATLICAVVDGVPAAAAVSAPALGQRWDAARGHGARHNGVAAHVSTVDALEGAQLLHGGLGWFREDERAWQGLGALVDRCERSRGFGDFWMHMLVATGAAEIAVEGDLNVWDVAAPACVVAEAGGRMTGADGGSPLHGGWVVTTNGALHAEVLGHLRGIVTTGASGA